MHQSLMDALGIALGSTAFRQLSLIEIVSEYIPSLTLVAQVGMLWLTAVHAVTLIAGIAVTAAIERRSNTRGIWTYSDLMPVLPGTDIGIAPLMQWIVIPGLAFAFV